jgi:hypothetical protein
MLKKRSANWRIQENLYLYLSVPPWTRFVPNPWKTFDAK